MTNDEPQSGDLPPESGESSRESPRSEEPTRTYRPAIEHEQIGDYRVLERIGSGGMGDVYRAEQSAPIRRTVALKVIKRGMDTDEVIARFESERQALALLDHPNIAKIFEAGSTPDGLPYFAMEFVPGVRITEHCDRLRLRTNERLELFMQVCGGVQHAHQNAIIHRDIKSSNILVAFQDDKAVPKIIDFGVAKAITQRLTERTLFTELGQMVGTPAYMSPEQAEMTGQAVDTRTDVYSLGVLLYELLVGALPFDPRELHGAAYDEIRRRIREDEPSKPSTRLSSLGQASSNAAKNRRTQVPTLVRSLRGDLDWITMKALEKDRSRRYGSPNELVADIERHLRHEPVLAGPPSAAYRARKFVRRHRLGVSVVTAAVLVVIGFAVRERMQSTRIAEERDRTKLEALTAQQVSEFLVGLFEVSDPGEARGNSITAREILDRGAHEIDATLADQPAVQARLMATIGVVYQRLGLYGEAEPLLASALETRRRVLRDDDPETLDSMSHMGAVLFDQDRFDEAEPYYREALRGYRRVFGDDHPETLIAINNLGLLLKAQGKLAEAEPYYREVLKAKRAVLQADDPSLWATSLNLGALLRAQRKLDEAEPYYRDALAGYRAALGDDHPSTLTALGHMGSLLRDQGKVDASEPYFSEALDGYRRVLGDEHRYTIMVMSNLGDVYFKQTRYDEARTLLAEAVEGAIRAFSRQHDVTGVTMGRYGRCLTAVERYDDAEALLLDAYEILSTLHGTDHTHTSTVVSALVELYEAWNRPDAARTWRTKLQQGADPPK